MAESKEKLFSDFTAPSRQEWRDKIEVDLKGADYQKKMVWRTNEGFSMEPFYLKEDVDKLATVNALPGEFPYVRGNRKADNAWYVRQDIVCDCPKEANRKALDIMERGVDSLGFIIPGDKVSAEYIWIYPPGIPVITIGEVINEEIVTIIQTAIRQKLNLQKTVSENQNEIAVLDIGK